MNASIVPNRTSLAILVLAASLAGAVCFLASPGLGAGSRVDAGRVTPERLILVRSSGGMVMTFAETSIFGDGRVRLDIYATGRSERLVSSKEITVDHQEVESLVVDAVNGGLLELRENALRVRQQQLGRPAPLVTDAMTIRVALDLRSLARDPEDSAANTFAISAPRQLSAAYPEIKEYAAVWKLVQAVDALNRRADATEGRKP